MFCRKLGHFQYSSICKIFNLIFTVSIVKAFNNQWTFAAFLLSFFLSNSLFGLARSTIGGYTKIASNTLSQIHINTTDYWSANHLETVSNKWGQFDIRKEKCRLHWFHYILHQLPRYMYFSTNTPCKIHYLFWKSATMSLRSEIFEEPSNLM